MKYDFEKLLLAIETFKFNEDEEAAYRMLLDYFQLKQQYFPEHRIENLPTRGDPRKSTYFKYCYKVIKETKEFLPPEHRKLYVKAQLQVLKMVEEGASINPNCLVGNKAWKRWLVWFKRFQRQTIDHVDKCEITPDLLGRIESDIKKSISFAKKMKCENLDCSEIGRWVKLGVISPYYLAVHLNGERVAHNIGLDLADFRSKIPLEMIERYNLRREKGIM